jgi:hypothetical protein
MGKRGPMFQESDFDSFHNIQPGKHFYQFYKQADDYQRVIIPFLKAGLKPENKSGFRKKSLQGPGYKLRP